MKKLIWTALLGLSIVLCGVSAARADENAHHITHLMKAMFDTPDNPLTVDPVVVVGDFAVAGWVQGQKGGRALLKKVDGAWVIHLCSGDGLKDAAVLHQSGLDEAAAQQMAADVAKAEASLDATVLKLMASFEGTVMIDGAAGHAGHAGHSAHGQTQEATP